MLTGIRHNEASRETIVTNTDYVSETTLPSFQNQPRYEGLWSIFLHIIFTGRPGSFAAITGLTLVFFSLCICVNAQPADEQVIRQQRINSNNAIAAHDTASLGLYWLDDITVITSRSVALNGKLVNQQAFQEEFQKKEKILYIRTPKTVEVFAPWNMASEYGQWSGTWISNGSAIKITGSYYAKWHKTDGTWKIKFEMFTPAACEGGDYCKELNLPQLQTPAIVVQNFYFPKAGKEEEVIQWRMKASVIRAQLGLPVGRILKRISESTSQPYILWECGYASIQAREEDVAKLDQSAAFKRVQEYMSTLLEKFDRSVWQIVK